MIPPALEEIDLSAVLAEFRDQEEKHGHTAESDARIPPGVFGDRARQFAAQLADVLLEGDRQNLDVAYRRAARLAAFALATQRRIRLERIARAQLSEGNGHDIER